MVTWKRHKTFGVEICKGKENFGLVFAKAWGIIKLMNFIMEQGCDNTLVLCNNCASPKLEQNNFKCEG